jgi:hypothetical protein
MFGSSQSAGSVYQKWHTPIRWKENISLSGAVGGKTGKTLVLSGSSIIERGRGSGGSALWAWIAQNVKKPTLLLILKILVSMYRYGSLGVPLVP